MIDRLEKVGRFVLWLVISGVLIVGFAIVPLQMVKRADVETNLQKAIAKLEDQLVEASKPSPKPGLLKLDSMGPIMRGLYFSDSEGRAWFTNVTPREGYVCAIGITMADQGDVSASSLPACVKVDPFSSASLKMQFASGELKAACPEGKGCSLVLKDAGEDAASTATPAAP